MRNRWFHAPLLHTPALRGEKKPTWLELFYDLIFVVAFIQVGNGLSANVSLGGWLGFMGVFVSLWVTWTGFTFFENRYTLDDLSHRMVVFVQMFAVGGMAVSAAGALEGDTLAFALSAGIGQILVGAMYGRAYLQSEAIREYSRYWCVVFLVSGTVWVASGFLPAPYTYACWGVAAALLLSSAFGRTSLACLERYPLDFEHLTERYGLLTIIVLGESFVKVVTALVDEGGGMALYTGASIVLLVTCGLWWVYFDDVAGSHIRKGRGKWIVWIYAHLPLQMGLVASGVALKKATHFSWGEPAVDGYRWLLAGSLALVFASVSAVDSVTERRQAELSDRARINVRWASAVLLLVLAPAGATLSGATFLVFVMVVVIAQVVFDMMMAPFEAAEHMEIGGRLTSDIAKEAKRTGSRGSRRPFRDVSEAVRKGTPSALRRDLYFYFMEGSWLRVFVAFGFLFVVTNVFFAALYVLEPGAIGHARPDSFLDAFFFSVQTMSTIGYGNLSPATEYGDAVATVEAALSMIGIAIVTGLVFAKASRPQSSILFSEAMVITHMHGKRVLMLRAGNARGNDVVDANVDVTVLVDEVSKEGHHMRRVQEVKLVRDRSPLFVLTWTMMHEIDDESPIKAVDWDGDDCPVLAFICTLRGHDGTYGQTIYARRIYRREDIRVDHRFVDILSELEDGRLMIDYGRFHDTVPDAAAEAEA